MKNLPVQNLDNNLDLILHCFSLNILYTKAAAIAIASGRRYEVQDLKRRKYKPSRNRNCLRYTL